MYARECEKHLGPFPKFRYEDAIEIPITQKGKRVIVTLHPLNPGRTDAPIKNH